MLKKCSFLRTFAQNVRTFVYFVQLLLIFVQLFTATCANGSKTCAFVRAFSTLSRLTNCPFALTSSLLLHDNFCCYLLPRAENTLKQDSFEFLRETNLIL